MKSQGKQTLLGVRVPKMLKEKLSDYCSSHGVKISFFVAEAIKEKLLELVEDSRDVEMANKRLKNAEFISQNEFDKYLLGREIKT